MSTARYVGGPFGGGTAPDDFLDEIAVRPAARTGLGPGRYVRVQDEGGQTVYRWEDDARPGEGCTSELLS